MPSPPPALPLVPDVPRHRASRRVHRVRPARGRPGWSAPRSGSARHVAPGWSAQAARSPGSPWRWVALVLIAVLLAVAIVGGVGPVRGDDEPSGEESAQVTGVVEPSGSGSRSASASGSGPAAAGVRPSGLAWHSGVFSHDAARTVEFEKTRGRPVDVLAVFPTRDSWSTIMQDWWMSPSAVPAGFSGTLAVGVPLFPDDGSMAQAAAGADVDRWEELGRLIASRYPDAWIRPGWEFNIPNWPWAVTPQNAQEYKAAFRHAVTGLRRGGPGLRIVFNPNEGRGASLPDATMAYPGDDVVDVIGIDAYDWYPAYRGEGWQEHRSKDQGWDYWAEFARSRGKKFAVPEWGVMAGSEASGGDNPDYIEAVLAWMGEHADLMAFDAYFEETEEYCRCALSLNPAAQAAYAARLPQAAAPDRAATAPDDAAAAPDDAAATPNDAGPDEPPGAATGLTPDPAAADAPGPSASSEPGAGAEPGADASPADTAPPEASPADTAPPDASSADTVPPDVPGERNAPPDDSRLPGRGRYGRSDPGRVASWATGAGAVEGEPQSGAEAGAGAVAEGR